MNFRKSLPVFSLLFVRSEMSNRSFCNSVRNSPPVHYKIELCVNFKSLSWCRYGKKCRFAHGTEELLPIPIHKNHKTSYCKNFSAGVCYYGSRCQFIHKSNERHAFESTDFFQPPRRNSRLSVFRKISAS